MAILYPVNILHEFSVDTMKLQTPYLKLDKFPFCTEAGSMPFEKEKRELFQVSSSSGFECWSRSTHFPDCTSIWLCQVFTTSVLCHSGLLLLKSSYPTTSPRLVSNYFSFFLSHYILAKLFSDLMIHTSHSFLWLTNLTRYFHLGTRLLWIQVNFEFAR